MRTLPLTSLFAPFFDLRQFTVQQERHFVAFISCTTARTRLQRIAYSKNSLSPTYSNNSLSPIKVLSTAETLQRMLFTHASVTTLVLFALIGLL